MERQLHITRDGDARPVVNPSPRTPSALYLVRDGVPGDVVANISR